MGAMAGAYFLNLLLKECQKRGAVEDSDFPVITLHSLSSTALDKKGMVNSSVLIRDVRMGLFSLARAGVDIAVIICHTAHLHYTDFCLESSVPILNLAELTWKSCETNNVGVLSSKTVRDKMLYGFGIQTIKEEQKAVNAAIGAVMSGQGLGTAIVELVRVTKQMKERGAETLLLACTELSTLDWSNYYTMPVIDPLQLAVDELLK
jgi:aspartate/glutamate racemase